MRVRELVVWEAIPVSPLQERDDHIRMLVEGGFLTEDAKMAPRGKKEKVLDELVVEMVRHARRGKRPAVAAGAMGTGGPGPPRPPSRREQMLSKMERCTAAPKRAAYVAHAAKHAWDSYVRHAWGRDTLNPVARKGTDDFGATAVTIIDSLDTLYLMGLDSRFQQGAAFLKGMNFTRQEKVSVFESTIRIVGGLLSAHELSGRSYFLDKCLEVADCLSHAFDTDSGVPSRFIDLKACKADEDSSENYLADFGTLQMEFYTMTAKSGNGSYWQRASAPVELVHKLYSDQGLLPTTISIHTAMFNTERVSLGAMGDSYYEYLLKVWILSGKEQEALRGRWELAMDEMLQDLVFTTDGGMMYVAEKGHDGDMEHAMHHLACFVPGMLALGVYHKAVTSDKATRYMDTATGLAETCHMLYHMSATGLSPDLVRFRQEDEPWLNQGEYENTNARPEFLAVDPRNFQRPEAVESFYVLHYVTGDAKYQEYAWSVFIAFQRHSWVGSSLASNPHLTIRPVPRLYHI